jgi:serine/threonine-protein kinase
MTFAAGTRLGSYEIIGPLGKGGMGEVFRARDTTLGREVAIKTLPSALAKEPDRLARFEREAKLLAALNHPHIAVVYGLDEHEGTKYLAMELVEGETLERKLQGALPVEEALRIALQIAEALEAAHEKGVVHRDLKPANLMVTPNGQVKVLDFGLAKAFSGDPSSTMIANSPALSLAMTQQGFILGTAGYMSPEQASGQASDQRADIWAFGVVLFELLTGKPLFSGESVPHVLADVLRTPPDWNRLPKGLHPRIRQLLERCLEKNARNRYHSIADVRVDIESALADPHGLTARADASAAPQARSIWARAGSGTAIALLGAAIAAVAAWAAWPTRDHEVTRFSVDLAGPLNVFDSVALSPDGRRIVYSTNNQLYSQRLDQDEPTPIPGTEMGSQPFFAPDGDSVAYFTETQLKAIGFGGEAPRVLANVMPQGIVGAWSRDGRIFFGQSGPFGLSWVPAVGGEPESFAALGDFQDVDYPNVLPGERWVLFTGNKTPGNWSASDIVVQNAATGERTVVLKDGHYARYLPSGHLVFARGGTLYAVPFDATGLETLGRAVPVVQGLATSETGGNAQFAVASNGTLVYQPGAARGAAASALVSATTAGETTLLSTELRSYTQPRVSPDGSRVAVEVEAPDADARTNVWIMDLKTGSATQLTFEGDENRHPIWTREGNEVLYISKRGTAFSIYRQLADGSGEAVRVLDGTDQLLATDVLPGNVLLYQDRGDGGSRDLFTFDLASNGPPQPFLATPDDERMGRGSPSGAWIAYVTGSDIGSLRVYARPYPNAAGGQRAVSEGPGIAPVWSPRGDEIYFIGPPPSPLMAVPVSVTPTTITPSRPRELFLFFEKLAVDIPALNHTAPYDVMPNGDGFVGVGAISGTSDGVRADRPHLKVVLNWFEELERLVPTN